MFFEGLLLSIKTSILKYVQKIRTENFSQGETNLYLNVFKYIVALLIQNCITEHASPLDYKSNIWTFN